jgi:hypothetical protein
MPFRYVNEGHGGPKLPEGMKEHWKEQNRMEFF